MSSNGEYSVSSNERIEEGYSTEAKHLIVAAWRSDRMVRWKKRRNGVFSIEAGSFRKTRIEGLEIKLWFAAIMLLARNGLIHEVGPLRYQVTDKGDQFAIQCINEKNR